MLHSPISDGRLLVTRFISVDCKSRLGYMAGAVARMTDKPAPTPLPRYPHIWSVARLFHHRLYPDRAANRLERNREKKPLPVLGCPSSCETFNSIEMHHVTTAMAGSAKHIKHVKCGRLYCKEINPSFTIRRVFEKRLPHKRCIERSRHRNIPGKRRIRRQDLPFTRRRKPQCTNKSQ